MKEENAFKLLMVVVMILTVLTYALLWRMGELHHKRTSQSCWQIGDTLHVVTAKGDTVRFDLSKFDQNETNTTASN